MRFLDILKDILWPKKCYNCNKIWSFLCKSCLWEIWFFEEICPVCKTKSKNYEVHEKCKNWVYYDNIIILTHYRNKIIKKLIKDWKYYNKKDIFIDFSYYLSNLLKLNYDLNQKTIIIPTPMYFLKKLIRWYNQAEILAYKISKNIDLPYNNKIIKKLKWTKRQSSLNKKERLSNLEKSFFLNKKDFLKFKDYDFIIVDDVFSTWTTINEISKILKQNWIKKIIWLILASD